MKIGESKKYSSLGNLKTNQAESSAIMYKYFTEVQ